MADLGFLAHLPELCDVTFMVGPDKVLFPLKGTMSQKLHVLTKIRAVAASCLYLLPFKKIENKK
jgi:hypothetical protein